MSRARRKSPLSSARSFASHTLLLMGLLLAGCISEPTNCGDHRGGGTEQGNPCGGPGTEEGNPALKVAVLAPDSTPVPGARLILCRKESSLYQEIAPDGSVRILDSVTADSLGRHAFDGLPNGTYGVAALDPKTGFVAYRQSIEYDSSSGIDDTIFVARPSALKGRVELLDYREHLVGKDPVVQVTFEDTYLWFMVKAGEDFVLEGLPTGKFELSFFAPKYVRRFAPSVELAAGDTLDLDVVELHYSAHMELPEPKGLKRDSAVGSIRLKWEAVHVADLSGYQVRRMTSSAGGPSGTQLLLTTDTTWLDTLPPLPGTVYSVRSLDSSGNVSLWSGFKADADTATAAAPNDTVTVPKDTAIGDTTGSERTTIVVRVTHIGTPVANALVSRFALSLPDTACLDGYTAPPVPTDVLETDSNGIVHMELSSISGLFHLTALPAAGAGKGTLAGARFDISPPFADTLRIDMVEGVTLSGRVSREGKWSNHPSKNDGGIEVSIPDSPWFTLTRNDGSFRLEGLPTAFPRLRMLTYEFEVLEIESWNLAPGSDTALGTHALRFFPCKRVPPPREIEWEADAPKRTLALSWNNLGDSAHYTWDLERCLTHACATDWERRAENLENPSWTDNLPAWSPGLLRYRVRTRNTQMETSQWMSVDILLPALSGDMDSPSQ